MPIDYGASIPPVWHNLIKRLSKVAYDRTHRRESSGDMVKNKADSLVIIKVAIIMDANQQLLGWTEPRGTRLEPGNRDWIELLSQYC